MTINTQPARKDLLLFGTLLPIFFLVLGFLIGHRADSVAARGAVWMAGAGVTLLYFAIPALRRPIFVGWSYATYPIGWLVSHVLLLTIFVVVITPIGLLVRLFRGDVLGRRFDHSAQTYWSPCENVSEPKRYFQQF